MIRKPVRQQVNALSTDPLHTSGWRSRKRGGRKRTYGGFLGHCNDKIPVLAAGVSAPATRPSSGDDKQAAGGEVLPVEDGSLFRWPVTQMDYG